MFFLYVFIMASVTYLIRMLPFTLVRRKITNVYVKSFLHYVPYAVLGGMTFPSVIYSTGNVYTALAGLIVALVLAFLNRSLLTVAVASCVSAFVCGLVF